MTTGNKLESEESSTSGTSAAPNPTGNGDGRGASGAQAREALKDLSDGELEKRIEELESVLGKSRAALIQRYLNAHGELNRSTRAVERRRKQKRNARRARSSRAGVSEFDGRPVASWMVPHLRWAREHGWKGTVISGYRDPVESEAICRQKCGAPSCPGTCAGRASNHSGKVQPAGALDISEHVRFVELMRSCPHLPRIFNALGPADPNHFSATGR